MQMNSDFLLANKFWGSEEMILYGLKVWGITYRFVKFMEFIVSSEDEPCLAISNNYYFVNLWNEAKYENFF